MNGQILFQNGTWIKFDTVSGTIREADANQFVDVDSDVELGGVGASDLKVPTQKAVREYIEELFFTDKVVDGDGYFIVDDVGNFLKA